MTDDTKTSVAIYGATSAIAEAVARRYAAAGHELFLVARDAAKLDLVAADLRIRGAGSVAVIAADLDDADLDDAIFSRQDAAIGTPDIALVAFGVLGDQESDERDPARALGILGTNLLSPVRLLLRLAMAMEDRGSGTLCAITSVSGDRGRRSNHLYGAAKGGLSIFLDGLRDRLAEANVAVVDVRPGFVDTPMTRDFEKGILFASPGRVAADIDRAIARRRAVVYTPWFWRWIMLAIRLMPRPVLRRLNL